MVIENITNYDQGCKQGSSNMLCKIHEHQTEVKTERTSTTKPFHNKDDDVREDRPEQKISFTHEDSDVEKQDKELEDMRQC